jgi:dTDP-4-dehydrorhamnose reductase
MRIFIVGAKGQLGSDCCSMLATEGDVVGCDLPQMNIADESSVTAFVAENSPDIIINCAAFTAVDACETETELAWKVNCDGPGYLAKAAHAIGAKLLHISTDYVFDGYKPAPAAYIETDSPNPLSQYGKSKLAGEQAVMENLDDYLILRTAWLYGANGKNFLKTMLRLALQDSERELKVVNDQYGSLTWSDSLTRQIKILVHSDLRGIVHATADGHSTWYEGARYFLDTMGVSYRMRPCTTAEYPTPAHRPANSILANTVLDRAGISVFPDWKKDIQRFVATHRERLLAECNAIPNNR